METEFDENVMEKVECNLCGADDYEVAYPANYGKVSQQELSQKFRSSGDELLLDQMVKCKHCGLQYVNPRIKQEMIVKGYSEGTDENFVSQAKYREKTFDKSLKNIEKFTGGRKGKILDIGTAGGTFLQAAKKRGWEVEGIEPNKWLCEWSRKEYGIPVRAGELKDHPFPDATFDVITLWDVLEHVPDPTAVLKECNRILKTGGILVVNYPDIGSMLAKAMKRKWVFLLSVHLFYFTPKTIRKILRKTDFEVLKTKPHCQTLALGYLMFRMKAYSNLIHKVGSKVTDWFHLGGLQIHYWLGQTLVLAKKK